MAAGEYCTRDKTSDCAPLAGMGVRVKRIAGIGVKVYACGLYVDPTAARKAVGWGGYPLSTRPAASVFDPSFNTR